MAYKDRCSVNKNILSSLASTVERERKVVGNIMQY